MQSGLVSPGHRLWCIDALRGYAILGVVIVHCGLMFPQTKTPAILFGMMGVDLFFVVSAFAIALSWHARSESAWCFYLRRFFRIAPMFWLALILYVLWSKFGLPVLGKHRPLQSWQIAVTALMLHGLHSQTANYVVPGDWSISVELAFYLIFPVMAAFVTTRDRAAALIFLTIATYAFAGTDLGILDQLDPQLKSRLLEMWDLSLPSHFIAFASGLYAYFAYNETPTAGSRSLQFILIIAVLILLGICVRQSISVQAYSMAFGVILLCTAKGAGQWLNFKLIRRLGEVSYSVYLLHFCVIDIFVWIIERNIPGLAGQHKFAILLTCVLAAAMIVGSQTFRFVERPAIRLGGLVIKRLATKRPRKSTGLTATNTSLPLPFAHQMNTAGEG